MKNLIIELVLEAQGTFESDWRNSIRTFKVSGITIKRKQYATDKKDRYFHIYYDYWRKAYSREKLEDKIYRMGQKLRKQMGEPVHPGGDYKKHFDLVFWHEGIEDEKFMSRIEQAEVINRVIRLCGYFVIVTSAKMTAEEALILYKSRDSSEKTFSADESCLRAHYERVYSNESVDIKLFIRFVATIIRSRIYTLLKDELAKLDKKPKYMTMPVAVRELEKIEMLKGADN